MRDCAVSFEARSSGALTRPHGRASGLAGDSMVVDSAWDGTRRARRVRPRDSVARKGTQRAL